MSILAAEQDAAPGTVAGVVTVTEVSAADITSYRAAARSLLFNKTGRAASPVHGFTVSHPAFNLLIDQLVPGPKSIVHLQQELHAVRAMVPGDVITTRADIVAVRAEPQGSRVTINCRQTDDGGATVTELKATVLVVGYQHPASFGGNPGHPAVPKPLPDRDAFTFEVTPTEAFVAAYAVASGDHNPIHTEPAAALEAGFPGPIAHGMSSIAVGCEIAADHFGGGDVGRIESLGARFSAPILPGEPLVFSLRPTVQEGIFTFSCSTPRGPAVKAGWINIRPAEGKP